MYERACAPAEGLTSAAPTQRCSAVLRRHIAVNQFRPFHSKNIMICSIIFPTYVLTFVMPTDVALLGREKEPRLWLSRLLTDEDLFQMII